MCMSWCPVAGSNRAGLEIFVSLSLPRRHQRKNIVANQAGQITFKYVESRTGTTQYRTLKGEAFLWLVLQHVLPKGLRRVRDYGFLHGNAKPLLSLVQRVLQVLIASAAPRSRPVFKCPKCHSPMLAVAWVRPAWRSG